MSKTLYVHIGVHKTGSTAIQSYFTWHLPLLRCFGADLDYPRLGGRLRTRNQDIADDLGTAEGGFATQARYLERVAHSRAGSILLSAEQLCHLPRAPEYFEPFTRICQVRIVVFLRRQDRFMESMYRQMVRNTVLSKRKAFSGYAERKMGMRAPHQSLDWEVRLEPWRKIFGAEHTAVIPYAEGRAFDSVSAMGRELSVPVSMRLPLLIRKNSSLCCETIEMVRRLEGEGIAVARNHVLHFDRAVPQPSSCYLDEGRRRRIVTAYEGSNRAVGRIYGCDMSPLLPGSLSPQPPGRIFDERSFDYQGLLPLAKRTGLIRSGK